MRLKAHAVFQLVAIKTTTESRCYTIVICNLEKMKKMRTRAADATIKGYYYQFATSILQLLDLQFDTDAITVEGIEDIDIKTTTETTAIQCKYLSMPRLINSVVRKPIILMLDHFVNL